MMRTVTILLFVMALLGSIACAGELDYLIHADDAMSSYRMELAMVADEVVDDNPYHAIEYAAAVETDAITIKAEGDKFVVMIDYEKMKEDVDKSSKDKDGNIFVRHKWLTGLGVAAIGKTVHHNSWLGFNKQREEPVSTSTVQQQEGDNDEASIVVKDNTGPVNISVTNESPGTRADNRGTTGSQSRFSSSNNDDSVKSP